MSGDVTPYLKRVPGQHRNKPNFIATLTALVQPGADALAGMAQMFTVFDIDTAAGVQLDMIGTRIGRSRFLTVPLTGVYFTFDNATLGFDAGVWLGPYDPATGLVSLPDDTYRLYLKAALAANKWDGTIPGAYAALSALFAAMGDIILIFDGQDMTMTFLLLGPAPTPIVKALFSGGYLSFKPAGVGARDYYTSTGPAFAFDAQNANLAGFDTGLWAAKV